MRQHRTSACLMYHDCWTFREALFGGKDSIPGRSGGRLRDRALRICRDYSAHGTRRNGIYRLSEYHGSPEYGAPGLRHTLASTIVLASAVRRDYDALGPRYTGIHDCLGVCGAPGLRCAGTSVHRGDKFSGEHPRAPRFPAQVGTTCGARRPGSSDRASRSCRVSRQNPPRAPSSAGPGSGGNHPCPSPAALREQLRGYQRRTQRLALSGPEYFC